MRKTKRIITVMICGLLCVALSGCGHRKIFKYSKPSMTYHVSMIIRDRFASLKKIGKGSNEAGNMMNIWEVTLPDRNDMKVHFYNYIDGGGTSNGMANPSWHNYIKTDYVGQVLSSVPQEDKNPIDEKYGIVPDNTDIEFEDYSEVTVVVHTHRDVEDFSEDEVIDYINECLDLYDLQLQPAYSFEDGGYNGVEELIFKIVFDDVHEENGEPFYADMSLVSGTMSNYKLKAEEGQKFDEGQVRYQYHTDILRFTTRTDSDK